MWVDPVKKKITMQSTKVTSRADRVRATEEASRKSSNDGKTQNQKKVVLENQGGGKSGRESFEEKGAVPQELESNQEAPPP